MTVRFPNGQAVQYNDANFVTRHSEGYSDLRPSKDGRLIAQVPNSCIIELSAPCRVYNPLSDGAADASVELQQIMKDLRALKRRLPVKK